MKKKEELKVTYNHVEPKTPQEAEEAERRLSAAYDILFEATLESDEWKKYKATRRGEKA